MLLFFALYGSFRIVDGTSIMVKNRYDTFVKKLTKVHVTCLKKSTCAPRGGQILVDPIRPAPTAPDPTRDFRFSHCFVRSRFEFFSNRAGRGGSRVA
jgi:hypothetical protein